MSSNDYKSSSRVAQLGGARRKNGHKATCSCHICENMKNKAKRGGYEEDIEKENLKKMGGSKKKNGHKPNCACPICKNMKNKTKKRGGGDDDEDKDMDEEGDEDKDMDEDEDEDEEMQEGGKKKGNGHKANCKCPICKNMKKSKKGGDEPDIENQLGDIEEGGIIAEKTTTSSPSTNQSSNNGTEIVASEDEYDLLSAAEKGEAGPNLVGGSTRKRRGSRSRKTVRRNMRKGRKTMRHRKRSHRRR